MAAARPMVNVYETGDDGEERLVYRPMTDDEYAQCLADRETIAAMAPAMDAAPAEPLAAALAKLPPDTPMTAGNLLDALAGSNE